MSKRSFRKVWLIPVLFIVLTTSGLLAALLGTGIWYVAAWMALTIPLAIILYKIIVSLR